MPTDDICGSLDTSTGDPCQFKPGESCPWHDESTDPDTRRTDLERNPGLIDKVSDRLASGDTVAEACAEVPEVSERQYYEWRGRADSDGGVFREFRDETTRARKGAGRQDRSKLMRKVEETGDTRTWYKMHMKQYGDQYGDEDADMREDDPVTIEVSENVVETWPEQ